MGDTGGEDGLEAELGDCVTNLGMGDSTDGSAALCIGPWPVESGVFCATRRAIGRRILVPRLNICGMEVSEASENKGESRSSPSMLTPGAKSSALSESVS